VIARPPASHALIGALYLPGPGMPPWPICFCIMSMRFSIISMRLAIMSSEPDMRLHAALHARLPHHALAAHHPHAGPHHAGLATGHHRTRAVLHHGFHVLHLGFHQLFAFLGSLLARISIMRARMACMCVGGGSLSRGERRLSWMMTAVLVLCCVGGHQCGGHGQNSGQGEHQGVALHRFHEYLQLVGK
jgi:hypothetical protein